MQQEKRKILSIFAHQACLTEFGAVVTFGIGGDKNFLGAKFQENQQGIWIDGKNAVNLYLVPWDNIKCVKYERAFSDLLTEHDKETIVSTLAEQKAEQTQKEQPKKKKSK